MSNSFKRYQGQFITDDRFSDHDTLKEDLENMLLQLEKNAKENNLELQIIRQPYKITFEEGKTTQWRFTFILTGHAPEKTFFLTTNTIKPIYMKKL